VPGGTVKLRAVEQRAPIIANDRFIDLGLLAHTPLEDFVLQSAGQGDDAFLLLVLGQKLLALAELCLGFLLAQRACFFL
jgi:hypothetical protein